jgi:hypothetical protein
VTTTPRAAPSAGLPFWRTTGLALIVVGIAVTVGGTFGPWLRSGSVERNSFQMVGTLERFPLIDNWAVRAAVGAWPYLGPALMIPLVLAAFRLWRSTGVAAALLGIVAVVPSATALFVVGTRSRFGISLLTTGPLTVIAGAMLMLTGSAVLLLSRGRDTRVSVGRTATTAAVPRPAGNR